LVSDAQQGQRRTNAEKQKSVLALLATETYTVALAASVDTQTVINYRNRLVWLLTLASLAKFFIH
jgi:hypothetical protein